VTGLPDEKKGERLAVVHVLDDARIPPVLARLQGMGLPNLFVPRRQDFVTVMALPVLGTGKTDLRAVKRIAQEAADRAAAANAATAATTASAGDPTGSDAGSADAAGDAAGDADDAENESSNGG
jgi:hypothetical protein